MSVHQTRHRSSSGPRGCRTRHRWPLDPQRLCGSGWQSLYSCTARTLKAGRRESIVTSHANVSAQGYTRQPTVISVRRIRHGTIFIFRRVVSRRNSFALQLVNCVHVKRNGIIDPGSLALRQQLRNLHAQQQSLAAFHESNFTPGLLIDIRLLPVPASWLPRKRPCQSSDLSPRSSTASSRPEIRTCHRDATRRHLCVEN